MHSASKLIDYGSRSVQCTPNCCAGGSIGHGAKMARCAWPSSEGEW